MQRALIFGLTGQDGSYLAELLLSKGYEVHGTVRRSSTNNLSRIEHLPALNLHYADLSDSNSLDRVVGQTAPHEIYNLAAQSHVAVSFANPEYTANCDATGTIRILESVRAHAPQARFYQASSSEMFGLVQEIPQRETTPFHPRSPYGCSKVFSYWAVRNYRESYGLHASNGILFNHESPRRGLNFVTRKITRAVARIKFGLQDKVKLGNLDAQRDWGFAGDYVDAMWRMLQQPSPDDYVIATGQTWTVRDFARTAFAYVGLDWNEYVETDAALLRPAEVDLLIGDATKAKTKLGWSPRVGFDGLVRMMVDADIDDIKSFCTNCGQTAFKLST